MAEAYAQPHGGPATRLLSLLLHRALQNRVFTHHSEVHWAAVPQASRGDCTRRYDIMIKMQAAMMLPETCTVTLFISFHEENHLVATA